MAVLGNTLRAFGLSAAALLAWAFAVRQLRRRGTTISVLKSGNVADKSGGADAGIIEALPIALAYFNGSGRLCQVDEELRQLLPVVHALNHQDMSRLDFFRAVAEAGIFVDAAGRVDAFLDDVAARAEAGVMEWDVNLTDGRSLHIRERNTTEGGRLLTCVDVTSQRRQSWELDEKSELLRTSLESLDQGVWAVDANGALLTWNQRYFDLFGVTSEIAATGLPLATLAAYLAETGLLDGNSPDFAARRVAEIMTCNPPQYEMRGRNGHTLDVRRNPLPDGGVIITITDITSSQSIQEDLKRRSEELEAIFANLDVGIAFIDGQGEMVAVNEVLLELQGLDLDKATECRNIRDILRLNAENGELGTGEAEALVDAHLEMAFGKLPNSYQRIRPNGQFLEFRTFAMPGGGVLVAC